MNHISNADWGNAEKSVGTTRVKQAQWLFRWMEQPYIPNQKLNVFIAELSFFIDASLRRAVTENHAREWHRRLHDGYCYLTKGRDLKGVGRSKRRYWEIRVSRYYTGVISKLDDTANRLVVSAPSRPATRYDARTRHRTSYGLSTSSGATMLDSSRIVLSNNSRKHSDDVNEDLYKALRLLEGLLCTCVRCKAFFIRVRKQQYCSPQCNDKARMDRFLDKT